MTFKRMNQAVVFLAVILISAGAWAATGVPLVINHQGRLLDGTDKPVADGSYTIIYSLFTQPTGGAALWTETQPVTTKGGLFSVMLGTITPMTQSLFDSDSLYLETQMQGEVAMTPRLRLGTVPSAAKSGRLDGDVVTRPGSLRASNTAGTQVIKLATGDLSSSIAIGDPGVNGNRITDSVDQASARRRLSSPNLGSSGQDGVELQATPTGATFRAINTKGTGEKLRSCAGHANEQTADILLEADLDGDGVMESTISDSVDALGASRRLKSSGIGSSGQDGVEIQLSTKPGGATFKAIQTKGTGAAGMVAGGHADTASANILLEADVDGDGSPDNVVIDSVDNLGAYHAINTKGTGAQGGRVASTALHDGTTSMECVSLNGLPPGTPVIGTLRCTTDTGSAHIQLGDLDGDGYGDMLVARDSAEHEVSVSTNGPLGVYLMKAKEKANRTKCSSNLRCTAPDMTAESDISCDTGGVSLAMMQENLGSSGQDGVQLRALRSGSSMRAINTKGTGATLRSCEAKADSIAASVVVAADLDGDGTPEKQISSTVDSGQAGIAIDEPGVQVAMGFRKGWDGTIKGRLTIDDGSTPMVEMNSAGDGFLDGHLGIGMRATHSIDVAGGAYCDGSNWVNASDVNLKENFQPVDGARMLDQIDALPISQWNYKSECPDVTHIGPTAQDFKKVFGVGENDKSISTIDPSGIALAAIKELHRQNAALKDQVAELSKKAAQIDELQKQIDELKKSAAQTDQLRAQIKELSDMVEMILGARNVPTTNRLASSK